MKTTHRSIPNDIFSVEEKGRFIRIVMSLQRIHVDIGVGDKVRDYDEYTFDQFYTALAALLNQGPPSPPSPDNKEAATALPKGESGHSGFKVGDKVLIPSDHGSVGFITKIRDLGMVDVQTIDGRELTRPIHCLQPRL